jgi:hypothetical protein
MLERDQAMTMKLPDLEHTSRPWRIHEIAPDFKLEDVWELPARGAPGDFPRLVQMLTSLDPAQGSSRISRTLWAVRWKVGGLLGWDDPDAGLGSRVPTLRDRLPADLVRRGHGPEYTELPFTPLYLTDHEYAAEIANETMHGVLHLGAVEREDGSFRAQMAVLVKTNGRFGDIYMAAIRPFRHWIIYPVMMREGREMWERMGGATTHEVEGAQAGAEDLGDRQTAGVR